MDRKEKISLSSLLVSIIALMLNIFINRDKVVPSFSTKWWDFLNIQIPISLWILVIIIISSVSLLWKNRPVNGLKIQEIHIFIMHIIGNNHVPKADDILDVLLRNDKKITKTRLEFHLSELISAKFLGTYMGSYWLEQKGRAFLVKKGYA